MSQKEIDKDAVIENMSVGWSVWLGIIGLAIIVLFGTQFMEWPYIREFDILNISKLP